MTTTTIIGPVTVGSVANPTSNITKHTFASTSGAFNLQASFTGGSGATPSRIIIHYAPLMTNITADKDAVNGANPASFSFEAFFAPGTAERFATSDMEGCRGRYLLVWIEEPLMQTAASLTVKVTEY